MDFWTKVELGVNLFLNAVMIEGIGSYYAYKNANKQISDKATNIGLIYFIIGLILVLSDYMFKPLQLLFLPDTTLLKIFISDSSISFWAIIIERIILMSYISNIMVEEEVIDFHIDYLNKKKEKEAAALDRDLSFEEITTKKTADNCDSCFTSNKVYDDDSEHEWREQEMLEQQQRIADELERMRENQEAELRRMEEERKYKRVEYREEHGYEPNW